MSDFLKDIIKETGNEYASLVSEGASGDVTDFIDTGSYIFNALLGGSIHRGLPANKITAIAGESATGKTFFVLGMCKNFLDQNPDGGVIFFESESAVTKDIIEERDIDSSRMVIMPVTTVQEFRHQALTVLDTSCGWGDRLAGFFASDAEEYYGCDPNPNTYQRYQEQIATYNKFLTKPKVVKIWNCGAEDLPYDKLPQIDCAFTSPPYFSTEEYNKGGELEENQSWFKFNEYDKWRDDFYLPVAEKTMSVSKFMFVNIMDPKVHGVRYYSGDELVDKFQDKFLGQIGMRIMQRPQGKAVFNDENGNFSKEKLDEHMNKMFIENVWCFGPECKPGKCVDLFKNSRKATLDEFFA